MTSTTETSSMDSSSHHNPQPLPQDRQWMPLEYEPSPFVVICGRGKSCAQHHGNVQFRALVKSYLPQYSRKFNTKLDKSLLLTAVVDKVRQKVGISAATSNMVGGGFVKKDPDTNQWYDVGDFLAREKVSQAFRDCLHENYKSSNLSKKKRRREQQLSEVPCIAIGEGETELTKSPLDTKGVSKSKPLINGNSSKCNGSKSNNKCDTAAKGSLQATPGENDVVLPNASGESSYKDLPHSGNVYFRTLVQGGTRQLLQQGQPLDQIVNHIMFAVWEKGGKFLLGSSDGNNVWQQASSDVVRNAISQALVQQLQTTTTQQLELHRTTEYSSRLPVDVSQRLDPSTVLQQARGGLPGNVAFMPAAAATLQAESKLARFRELCQLNPFLSRDLQQEQQQRLSERLARCEPLSCTEPLAVLQRLGHVDALREQESQALRQYLESCPPHPSSSSLAMGSTYLPATLSPAPLFLPSTHALALQDPTSGGIPSKEEEEITPQRRLPLKKRRKHTG